MSQYTWSCPACKASNLTDSKECRSCGCEATASDQEIESRRTTRNSRPARHLAWRIYSGVVVTLLVISAVRGGTGILNIAGSLTSFALAAPLLGYAWQRRLVPAWMGKVCVWSSSICVIALLAALQANRSGAWALMIGFVFTSPMLYANYVYAYRSEHLHRPPSHR